MFQLATATAVRMREFSQFLLGRLSAREESESNK